MPANQESFWSDDGYDAMATATTLETGTLPHPATLIAGDVVLYRTFGGRVAPARLIEPVENDRWFARDARLQHGLIYLDARSITGRLPDSDLLGEAA